MLLTVITPSLNRGTMIGRAIESVRGQDYDRVEHLVVDGGSSDGTLERLARCPEITAIVGPDVNLYDAINKGLAAARGEVICHLNSDDWFTPGVFGKVMALFARDPALEMVSGGAEVIALENGTPGRVLARQNASALKRLRLRDVISGIPLINARFFRRSLYQRVGSYDIRYPIAADRDFLMRALLAGVRNQPLPEVVYRYGSHEGSLSMAGVAVRQRLAEEYLRLARERCRECTGDARARRAYRRWRAWAGGYQVSLRLRAGAWAAAARLAADLLGEDPWWPLSFAAQATTHAAEIGLRR